MADALPPTWLYDPSLGGVLVRAHRPRTGGAVAPVVSDVVWTDVLGAVRWAGATLRCPPDLMGGSAWRTASSCAQLLRRLPRLCRELGEPWPERAPRPETATAEPRARLTAATERLTARLCAPGTAVPLAELADDVDELGAAALAVLVELTDWSAGR
ncbi:hypothetical protein [Modestobacter sp. NPDC049651]|uniref:hypothetical protein n=1 Tax=unclassified Modestobacter TaxID=2643866 RepID=UPI0033EE077C